MALKSIPVDSCKQRRNGCLVMKFPSKECKQKANAAINECFELDPQFLMPEPRKLKPKMAVVGITTSLPDGEIIASITEKSTDIKGFVEWNGI